MKPSGLKYFKKSKNISNNRLNNNKKKIYQEYDPKVNDFIKNFKRGDIKFGFKEKRGLTPSRYIFFLKKDRLRIYLLKKRYFVVQGQEITMILTKIF